VKLAAWLAALAAGALAAPRGDVARLRPGVFLYASPQLGDPNFTQTVVLLVQYAPEEGAMGLIINRPGDLDAKTALPALAGMPMYEGGPVQTEAMLALVRTRRPPPDAVRVLDDVYLSGEREVLLAAAQGGRAHDRVRVFSGYAGWTAGQLENEVKAGGWIVAPGDAAAVFSRQPGTLWRKVFVLLRKSEA
jgi:putative transcriptional regulator